MRYVNLYHQQLSYCVTQFVEKDPKLAIQVIESILAFWPMTYSPKEVLFLNEAEEILEMIQASEFEKIMAPLFKQIARCIGSPHFQVAERALFLWNNEYIVSLIAQNRNQVLPLVFEALYTNSRSHWNSTVHGLTCNVVKLFMEMDAKLFEECSAEYRERQEAEVANAQKKLEDWASIEKMAETSPLYARLTSEMGQTGMLAYQLRASQLKEVLEELDEGMDSLVSEGGVGGNFEVSKANDATRRKSVLPGGKNDESKAQVAVVATGEKLQTTYQADNES